MLVERCDVLVDEDLLAPGDVLSTAPRRAEDAPTLWAVLKAADSHPGNAPAFEVVG